MDSAGQSRVKIRTYVSALSCKQKLADQEDPTAKFCVRKVVEAAGAQAAHPGSNVRSIWRY